MPSSEMMQFGGGLFDAMGFEERHIPMELLVHAPESAKKLMLDHYPYEWAFVVPFQTVEPGIQELCREAPVVAWMSDCVWRYSDFGRYWHGAADYIVTTDAATLPRYGSKGILSNWGCREEWRDMAASGHALMIPGAAGFQGQCYGKRGQHLLDIAKAGLVPVIQNDAASCLLDSANYFASMAASTFSLCLTASSHGKPQMKSRLFEPQVLGSILVTEPVARLEEYWTPGVECLVFNDATECQRQMAALLDNPDRLAAMRDAARHRALTEHTYHHRFEAILARMGVPLPIPPPAYASAQEV